MAVKEGPRMGKGEASVLVVGAGVGGIRAALDLAEMGYRVLLIDSSPAIGGILSQLDYQFPNNHCGMCRMLPIIGRESASEFCMRKALFHDNIEILPFTEMKAVSGEPGAFQVLLVRKARQVDMERCIGCGKCVEVCPVTVPDEFNLGLSFRKAVYRPVPQNLPNTYLIDRDHCTKCGQCMLQCPTQAIDLFLIDSQVSVEVGAIILAGGSSLFDPAPFQDLYGYGTNPHVVTSLQFERILSSLGPTEGRLIRPADGKPLEKVAWLQCVGSRNLHLGRDFCSSVCCMFALKEAVLVREASLGGTDTAVFYMDMRTYGKGFYRYQLEAQKKGVRLIRCRVHSCVPVDDRISIRYVDEQGEIQEELFDLVVLSTGQGSQGELKGLLETMGVEVDDLGFVGTKGFSPVLTQNPGVFVCGSMTGLKDISETLVQGSAAANEAAIFLASKGRLPARGDKVQEKDLSREMPKVTMVLCRCAESTEPRIDWDLLAQRFRSQTSVEKVIQVDRLCSDETLDDLARELAPTATNRLLLGACLPHLYGRKFHDLATRLGLDPLLMEVVDLHTSRLQLGSDSNQVTRQAQLLLERAYTRLKSVRPTPPVSVPVEQRALVIGGGIGGMTAAVAIARMGHQVTLVERTDKLGGRLRQIHYTVDGLDPHRLLSDTLRQLEEARVQVLTNTEVVETRGSVGRFESLLRRNGGSYTTVKHGVAIVATGAVAVRPQEFSYGKSPRILTQEEFEEALAQFKIPKEQLKVVVMIQCVGSRDEQRPYCSRVCCSSALKNAFKVLEWNKDARIYVFYRDMMTYGSLEGYYTKARSQGVRFIQYRKDREPEVLLDGEIPTVRFQDPVLGREVSIKADILVLSTGMVPQGSGELARALGLERNGDGFFVEADPKWRPVECTRDGFFLCGTAHSPRSIKETIAQAQAAAQKALTVLTREVIVSARVIAEVKSSLCTLCQLCVAACPYGARWVDEEEERIVVDPLACRGCGSCATACPSGAAFVRGLEEKGLMKEIQVSLEPLQDGVGSA